MFGVRSRGSLDILRLDPILNHVSETNTDRSGDAVSGDNRVVRIDIFSEFNADNSDDPGHLDFLPNLDLIHEVTEDVLAQMIRTEVF